jgi:hypothetical protein
MLSRSFLLQTLALVCVSFVVTWVLVFHTPLFNTINVDYFGLRYVGGDLYEAERELRELEKLQPQEFHAVIKVLFEDLVEKPNEQLYMLKAAGDAVCSSPLIYCYGVPGKNVAAFVDMALTHKQTSETAATRAGNLATARLSLAVSLAALLVSIGGLFLKRKGKVDDDS